MGKGREGFKNRDYKEKSRNNQATKRPSMWLNRSVVQNPVTKICNFNYLSFSPVFPISGYCKNQSAESSKQGKVTRLKAIYLLKLRRHCQRTQSEIKQSRRQAAGKIPRQVG